MIVKGGDTYHSYRQSLETELDIEFEFRSSVDRVAIVAVRSHRDNFSQRGRC